MYYGGSFLSQNDATWTARLPPYVKEYLQNKKGISAGKGLVEYYKILKSMELPEKRKELNKAREYVLQLEEDVTQLENECSTEWQICDTIFEKVSKQEDWMNSPERISSILEKNSIRIISAKQFIEHYKEKGVK
jgi:hypothetical protein